jgi:hypothetical protein
MHHTAPWYLPWGLKLVPLPIPPGHPASGIPNPAGLHLLAPLPGIYAPEPRKVSLATLVSHSGRGPGPANCGRAASPRAERTSLAPLKQGNAYFGEAEGGRRGTAMCAAAESLERE